MEKKHLFILIAFFSVCASYAQRKTSLNSKSPGDGKTYTINWLPPANERVGENETASFLNFTGVQYESEKEFLPTYTVLSKIPGGFTAELSDVVAAPVTSGQELKIISAFENYLGADFQFQSYVGESRKTKISACKIVPLRKSDKGGYEKLISFKIEWKSLPSVQKQVASVNNFSSASVLSSGNWYRIGVTQTGVFKLDKAFFQSMGIDMDSVNPQNIRVYGNGGKMLPESNALYRPDDLVENAIFVAGETDGVFNDNDYVLFYGTSPHRWERQTSASCMKFRPKVNIYSDTSFYFITIGNSGGKRVAQQLQAAATPTHTVTTFDDHQYYEVNGSNLLKTGREWYGENFDIVTSYSFNFVFPAIVTGDTVQLEVSLANRMGVTDPNAYTVAYPGGTKALTTGPVSLTNYTTPFAADGSICTYFFASSSSFPITVTKNNSSALGWLNYIRLNARRQLNQTSSQLSFRDTRSVGAGNVAHYSIAVSPNPSLWEVTDPYNITAQDFNLNGSTLEFNQTSDSLRQYIVFNGSGFLTPVFHGAVANQNLHSITQADYIIVSDPMFVSEAQRLGDLHAQIDTLSYVIVTPQQCYNEFSSGSRDPVAIREFFRMLYKRAATADDAPKYVLLLGDGSYKHKPAPGNTNSIPTYQSPQSLQPTSSYTSDDFYGLLDDTEGDFSFDIVDVGIGRIPTRTIAETQGVVNKIFNYVRTNGNFSSEVNSCTTQNSGPMGDWRNLICFVADDEDNNLHVIQADSLARMTAKEHPTYNFNKIYFDVYKQESSAGGEIYPDVNREIDKQVEKGCLVINYTGHGGELGLAHEQVLTIAQVQQYSNINNLPLWFTATCEFSRYDDPDRVSAGEYVLFNPNGGGIALFSTVRLVYATTNFSLSLAMWKVMLDSIGGKVPAMGDVFMVGKQQVFLEANTRNFTLVGDPALRLAYPRQVVNTDSINGVSVTLPTDTMKALSKVTVKGHLSDAFGNKLNNFNGIIYPVVFDKTATINTLGNDPGSPPMSFKLQKNIIYRGKSSVTNGDFEFTFIVPKDISYNFGPGRISYYAHDGFIDATGYYNSAIVGGSDPNAPVDQRGPDIKLFMNDNKFVSGGSTDENPDIYAEISDSSGINTVGNGIGHDLVAILDNNSNTPIVLNDYYQADMNSFQSGKILYGLEGLSEGTHSLSLKVWDVQNNSNTAYTDFVVAKSADLALTHVLNYPNPFTTRTQFFFEHNQCCSSVDVVINVFTISGKVVKSISKTLSTQGFRTEGIEWDGKDEFGDKLGKGVYIYKVKIKDQDGKTAEQFEKLVILN